MEARNHLSAMGRSGIFRIRRAAVHLLSAPFMDVGSGTHCDLSLDAGRQYFRLDRAGGRWRLNVFLGTAVA